mgnify:CR=1 FL=1
MLKTDFSRVLPIDRAASVYRVVMGRNAREKDYATVTIAEAENYVPAETFESFIHKNRIIIIEGVLR